MTTFRRVGVLNRADAAMRFLRAARDHRAETGEALETVACVTTPDEGAAFAQLADDVVHLGAPLRPGPQGPRSAYADAEHVVERLRAARCDAVWLGWGFGSEDPELLAALEDAGLVVIGPPSDAVRRLGDKAAAKALAERCDVPLAPWAALDPDAGPAAWRDAAEQVGLPAMVKAANGGGGRGIRLVRDLDALETAVTAVRAEVQGSFGEGGLLVEAYLEGSRHLEVQFVVDPDGRATTFGVRDCSVQRRHQKVLEETPSPAVDDGTVARLTAATARLAEAAGYRGVGTAEFLADPAGRLAFLEVNARLQVEHTVTEAVWDVDLVRAQIDVALGRAHHPSPGPRGWAVQARLCAEDPEAGFQPAAGRLEVFRPPSGPGVRVDTGLWEGGAIGAEFDSMVAKVIGRGPDRDAALATLRRALDEFDVLVEDGATNRGLLLELLARPEVREATATTDWLDRPEVLEALIAPRHERVASVAAAIVLARSTRRQWLHRFYADVRLGIPPLADELSSGVETELELRGRHARARARHLGGMRWAVTLTDGSAVTHHDARFQLLDDATASIHLDGVLHRALFSVVRAGVNVDVGGSLHRVATSSAGTIRCPVPALVTDVAVAPGDRVEAGQRVCTLEAMKTETPVLATAAGVVVAVRCAPGQHASTAQVLVEIRPEHEGGDAPDPGGPAALAATPEPVLDLLRPELEALLGGYDVAPDQVPALVEAIERCDEADPTVVEDLLARFEEVEQLFDRSLLVVPDQAAAVSAEAAFFDFCRAHHRGAEAALVEVRPRLLAAFARYGVDDLEPDDELRAAMWHLAIARARAADRRRVTAALCRLVGRLVGQVRPADDEARRALATRLDSVRWTAAGAAPEVADAAALAVLELRPPRAGAGPRGGVDDAVLRLHRWSAFELRPELREDHVVVLRAVARDDAEDERVLAFVVVPEGPPDLAEATAEDLEAFEASFGVAVRHLRQLRAAQQRSGRRPWWPSVEIVVTAPTRLDAADVARWASHFEGLTRGLAVQDLVVHVAGTPGVDHVVRRRGRARLDVETRVADDEPLRPRTERDRRRLLAARLSVTDPWDVVELVTGRSGTTFTEHDLDPDGAGLVAVDRPAAQHRCGVVVGVVAGPLPGRPDPLTRVLVANDPLRSLASLGEAECRRIIGALDLADRLDAPVEWVSVSSGARIAFDSGTENLDWCAAVLRRIVEATEAGRTVHVITSGVNVGAQSYWDAEATMLMHTRGILVMVDRSSMVLTGRTALAYSGGVVAEDEVGIGGFERIMGPNGQAQYRAADLAEAYALLEAHQALCAPGPDGRAPAVTTSDPVERDVTTSPYPEGEGFATVGQIFDDRTNPGRKRPFAIRPVMAAVADADTTPLERFRTMGDASGAVVWDTRIGGHPVCMIGIESRPTARGGSVPLDGPGQWAGGTLYPHGSRKVARAINAASGNRAVVVLANLSGFDGSPESMRRRQLEYGAEIGRAVVHFDGPFVFVVLSRYHGGAYVVFSKALNPNLHALALEGSYASVIGGAPAAAVALGGEVRRRVERDPEVVAARAAVEAAATDHERLVATAARDAILAEARARHQSDVATEFDATHDVHRAVRVGSLDAVIAPARLRPAVVEVIRAASGSPGLG